MRTLLDQNNAAFGIVIFFCRTMRDPPGIALDVGVQLCLGEIARQTKAECHFTAVAAMGDYVQTSVDQAVILCQPPDRMLEARPRLEIDLELLDDCRPLRLFPVRQFDETGKGFLKHGWLIVLLEPPVGMAL